MTRATAAIGIILVASVLAGVVLRQRGRPTQEPPHPQASTVMINPKELLFSLPTLEDRLPAGEQVEGVPAGAFHLHEGDWRQVEFVGMGEERLVETELHALRNFAAQHRKGMGFTEIYV